MSKILGSFFENVTDQSADKTIADNGIAAAAASANAYLNATLKATTPDVRRLFSEYTTQSVAAHEALTNLSVQKDWSSPHDTPVQQLKSSYEKSQVFAEDTV